MLEEFDEQIFNALVEKIEILTPAHFVFELKSGLRVEERYLLKKKRIFVKLGENTVNLVRFTKNPCVHLRCRFQIFGSESVDFCYGSVLFF